MYCRKIINTTIHLYYSYYSVAQGVAQATPLNRVGCPLRSRLGSCKVMGTNCKWYNFTHHDQFIVLVIISLIIPTYTVRLIRLSYI
jgi:hypothetical protein